MRVTVQSLPPEKIAAAVSKRKATQLTEWGRMTQAAVLVPLVAQDGEWYLLFTKRTDSLAMHKGQISFPGGRSDAIDSDPAATALRETFEEIGVGKEKIAIAGTISGFTTQNGVGIVPVLGFMEWPVDLILSIEEVSRVLIVPLGWFADPKNLETRQFVDLNGTERPVLYYKEYQGDVVWGITAYIISQFVQLLLK